MSVVLTGLQSQTESAVQLVLQTRIMMITWTSFGKLIRNHKIERVKYEKYCLIEVKVIVKCLQAAQGIFYVKFHLLCISFQVITGYSLPVPWVLLWCFPRFARTITTTTSAGKLNFQGTTKPYFHSSYTSLLLLQGKVPPTLSLFRSILVLALRSHIRWGDWSQSDPNGRRKLLKVLVGNSFSLSFLSLFS